MGAELLEVLPDERGLVRLDGGAEIKVSFSPRGASVVGVGARGHVRFRKGNTQFPIWKTCCHAGKIMAEAAALVVSSWIAYRQSFQRTNCIELEAGESYTPAAIPSVVFDHTVMLRELEGSAYQFAGGDFAGGTFGAIGPWSAPPLQGYDIAESTLSSGIGSSTTVLPMVSTVGFEIGLAYIAPDTESVEQISITEVDTSTLTVVRGENAISRGAGIVVRQLQPEDLPRWVDFSVVEADGSGIIITDPTPSSPWDEYGRMFRTQYFDIIDNPPFLQSRTIERTVAWEYPGQVHTYSYDTGGGGGGGGGES